MFGKPTRDPLKVFKSGNHAVLHIRPVKAQQNPVKAQQNPVVLMSATDGVSTPQPIVQEEATVKELVISKQLLHNRTHFGETTLNAQKANLEGVKVVGTIEMCDVCLLAKARKSPLVVRAKSVHRPTIIKNPTDLSDKPGKVIHIDLEF